MSVDELIDDEMLLTAPQTVEKLLLLVSRGKVQVLIGPSETGGVLFETIDPNGCRRCHAGCRASAGPFRDIDARNPGRAFIETLRLAAKDGLQTYRARQTEPS